MRAPRLKSLVSAMLAFTYFTTQVALASVAESNLWQERRNVNLARKDASKQTQFASLPTSLPLVKPLSSVKIEPTFSGRFTSLSDPLKSVIHSIPQAQATVQHISDSQQTKKSPVVLIQDIHMNAEAQTNIAAVLQQLIDEKQVGSVAVEGAFTPFDLKPFQRFQNRDAIRKVADSFLQHDLMSAASYVALTAQTKQAVFAGVDDQRHYENNVAAYLDSRAMKERVKQDLLRTEQELQAKKKQVFSAPLQTFDDLRQAYHKGTLGMGAYLDQLAKLNDHNVDIAIAQFLEAYTMEQSLDFARVENERRVVVEKLASLLTPAEMENLVQRSLSYRMGQVGFGTFYREIKSLCDQKGLSLHKTPVFEKYLRYVFLSEGIKAEALFASLRKMENDLTRKYAITAEEKKLTEQSELYQLTSKLIEFSLTPEEWNRYQELREESSALRSFETFYLEADIRSHKMVANLLKMKSATAFVTGGFHTPLITQLLRECNIPYVVVSPKITKVDGLDGSAYLSAFAREKTPLDKLFSGRQLFLAIKSQQLTDANCSLNAQASIDFEETKKVLQTFMVNDQLVNVRLMPGQEPALNQYRYSIPFFHRVARVFEQVKIIVMHSLFPQTPIFAMAILPIALGSSAVGLAIGLRALQGQVLFFTGLFILIDALLNIRRGQPVGVFSNLYVTRFPFSFRTADGTFIDQHTPVATLHFNNRFDLQGRLPGEPDRLQVLRYLSVLSSDLNLLSNHIESQPEEARPTDVMMHSHFWSEEFGKKIKEDLISKGIVFEPRLSFLMRTYEILIDVATLFFAVGKWMPNVREAQTLWLPREKIPALIDAIQNYEQRKGSDPNRLAVVSNGKEASRSDRILKTVVRKGTVPPVYVTRLSIIQRILNNVAGRFSSRRKPLWFTFPILRSVNGEVERSLSLEFHGPASQLNNLPELIDVTEFTVSLSGAIDPELMTFKKVDNEWIVEEPIQKMTWSELADLPAFFFHEAGHFFLGLFAGIVTVWNSDNQAMEMTAAAAGLKQRLEKKIELTTSDRVRIFVTALGGPLGNFLGGMAGWVLFEKALSDSGFSFYALLIVGAWLMLANAIKILRVPFDRSLESDWNKLKFWTMKSGTHLTRFHLPEGDTSRSFPQPIKDVVGISYLARHSNQYNSFKSYLGRIVQKHLQQGNRNLNIVVIGPAYGEEMAGVLAATIEEFKANPAWGDLKTEWTLKVNGIEVTDWIAAKTKTNLSRQTPFVYGKVADQEPFKEAYRTQMNAIMTALNSDPEWSERAFNLIEGDATKSDVFQKVAGADAIFFNAVPFKQPELNRLFELFEKFAPNAILFSTAIRSADVDFQSIDASHKERYFFEDFQMSFDAGFQLAYAVATPQSVSQTPPAEEPALFQSTERKIHIGPVEGEAMLDEKGKFQLWLNKDSLFKLAYELTYPEMVRVSRRGIKVGRNTDSYTENGVDVQNKYVSKMHARLFFEVSSEGIVVYIEDIASTYGTFLDGDLDNPINKKRVLVKAYRKSAESWNLQQTPAKRFSLSQHEYSVRINPLGDLEIRSSKEIIISFLPAQKVINLAEQGQKIYLGRHQSNQIHIDKGDVSRKHAALLFQREGNRITVEMQDAGSSRGTTVEGKKLERAGQPVFLLETFISSGDPSYDTARPSGASILQPLFKRWFAVNSWSYWIANVLFSAAWETAVFHFGGHSWLGTGLGAMFGIAVMFSAAHTIVSWLVSSKENPWNGRAETRAFVSRFFLSLLFSAPILITAYFFPDASLWIPSLITGIIHALYNGAVLFILNRKEQYPKLFQFALRWMPLASIGTSSLKVLLELLAKGKITHAELLEIISKTPGLTEEQKNEITSKIGENLFLNKIDLKEIFLKKNIITEPFENSISPSLFKDLLKLKIEPKKVVSPPSSSPPVFNQQVEMNRKLDQMYEVPTELLDQTMKNGRLEPDDQIALVEQEFNRLSQNASAVTRAGLEMQKNELITSIREGSTEITQMRRIFRLLAAWVMKLKESKGNYHRVHLARDGGFFHLVDKALARVDKKQNGPDAGSSVYFLSRKRMSGEATSRIYNTVMLNMISAAKKEAKDLNGLYRALRVRFKQTYAKDADFKSVVDAVYQELKELGYDKMDRLIFVDTGFVGTIPLFLKNVLELHRSADQIVGEDLEENIQVALVQPSSIGFAQALHGFDPSKLNAQEKKALEKYLSDNSTMLGSHLEEIRSHPVEFDDTTWTIKETKPTVKLDVFFEKILAMEQVIRLINSLDRTMSDEERNDVLKELIKIDIEDLLKVDFKKVNFDIDIKKILPIHPTIEPLKFEPFYINSIKEQKIEFNPEKFKIKIKPELTYELFDFKPKQIEPISMLAFFIVWLRLFVFRLDSLLSMFGLASLIIPLSNWIGNLLIPSKKMSQPEPLDESMSFQITSDPWHWSDQQISKQPARPEASAAAPWWEWVFQAPVIIGATIGWSWPVLITVGIGFALAFGFFHRKEERAQQWFLVGFGLVLSSVGLLPLLQLEPSWISVVSGLGLNMLVHRGYNDLVTKMRKSKTGWIKKIGNRLPVASITSDKPQLLNKLTGAQMLDVIYGNIAVTRDDERLLVLINLLRLLELFADPNAPARDLDRMVMENPNSLLRPEIETKMALMLEAMREDEILEIGTGSDMFLNRFLIEELGFSESKLYAVDPHIPESLARANKNYVRGRANDDLPDQWRNKFPWVLAFNVGDPNVLFSQEMAMRYVKKDGQQVQVTGDEIRVFKGTSREPILHSHFELLPADTKMSEEAIREAAKALGESVRAAAMQNQAGLVNRLLPKPVRIEMDARLIRPYFLEKWLDDPLFIAEFQAAVAGVKVSDNPKMQSLLLTILIANGIGRADGERLLASLDSTQGTMFIIPDLIDPTPEEELRIQATLIKARLDKPIRLHTVEGNRPLLDKIKRDMESNGFRMSNLTIEPIDGLVSDGQIDLDSLEQQANQMGRDVDDVLLILQDGVRLPASASEKIKANTFLWSMFLPPLESRYLSQMREVMRLVLTAA